MKPTDVHSSTYFAFYVQNSDKDPKLKVCDHVTISKYKVIFATVYTTN